MPARQLPMSVVKRWHWLRDSDNKSNVLFCVRTLCCRPRCSAARVLQRFLPTVAVWTAACQPAPTLSPYS